MKTLFAICLSVMLFSVTDAQTVQNKNIRAMPSSIILVSVTQSAERCSGKKGVTNLFRVVSETPVDIARFANIRNNWGGNIWLDQKKGDEFTDQICVASAPLKYFSRPAGSTEKFPKP